jgi:hypothetical protein
MQIPLRIIFSVVKLRQWNRHSFINVLLSVVHTGMYTLGHRVQFRILNKFGRNFPNDLVVPSHRHL